MEDPTAERQTCGGTSNTGGYSLVPNDNGVEAATARSEFAYGERECLEMFMRAWHGDHYAQGWFQGHFRGVLLDWFTRHPKKEAACRLYREEYYIERAFQCAWQIPLDRPPFEWNTLATVIRCLCTILHRLILDALRNPLPGLQISDSMGALCNQVDTQKIWSMVQESLSNEHERRMAYLLFHCGLKPLDIVATYPQEFNDVRAIARLRLSIIKLICDRYEGHFLL